MQRLRLISADPEIMPEALAGLAASAALIISPIPFEIPISEVCVARIDGAFIINPAQSVLEKADLALIVGGTADSIIMVEGEMNEAQEIDMIAAIQYAHEAIKIQCAKQKELAALVGITKFKLEPAVATIDESITKKILPTLYHLEKVNVLSEQFMHTWEIFTFSEATT